jgi:phospholipid/cholesterol/gamma-HCH transport system ATP-binding protein
MALENNNSVINLKNIVKTFGTKEVLKDVNLSVQKGEHLVIVGGSGSGKSVLFKIITGILSPSSGEVFINGFNVSKKNQNDRLKLGLSVGMLFQHSALFDSLSVMENIVFPITVNNSLSKLEQVNLATKNLELVGLNSNVLNLNPSELSGGMRKRVALARLLAQKPEIMLFDEPTTGLDPVMSATITNLIKTVSKYLNATSITITHDMSSAKVLGSSVAFISNKTIAWQGSAADILNPENKLIYNFAQGLAV